MLCLRMPWVWGKIDKIYLYRGQFVKKADILSAFFNVLKKENRRKDAFFFLMAI